MNNALSVQRWQAFLEELEPYKHEAKRLFLGVNVMFFWVPKTQAQPEDSIWERNWPNFKEWEADLQQVGGEKEIWQLKLYPRGRSFAPMSLRWRDWSTKIPSSTSTPARANSSKGWFIFSRTDPPVVPVPRSEWNAEEDFERWCKCDWQIGNLKLDFANGCKLAPFSRRPICWSVAF